MVILAYADLVTYICSSGIEKNRISHTTFPIGLLAKPGNKGYIELQVISSNDRLYRRITGYIVELQ